MLTARLSVLSWLAPCLGHPSPECQTRPSCQQGHVLECTAALPDPEDPRLRSVGQWPASHVPDARARAGRECGRSTAKEQTQFCLRLTGEGAKLRHCRSSSRQPGVGGRGGAAGRQMRSYRPAPPPGRGGPSTTPQPRGSRDGPRLLSLTWPRQGTQSSRTVWRFNQECQIFECSINDLRFFF